MDTLKDHVVPFLGGQIVCRKAGTFEAVDPDTKLKQSFEWDNHILVQQGFKKAKLTGAMAKAIRDAFKDKEFSSWVDQC